MTAIVAMTPSRVIGRGDCIPWRLPEDLRWFKGVTLGHPVLMGRKTFCSLPRPLPGRRNLVVSRLATFAGVEMVRDLYSFDPRPDDPEIFVIGGAEVYAALLPRCRALLVTHVRTEHPGDTYFPAHEHLFRQAAVLRETPEFTIVRYERMGEGDDGTI
ncbi:MAG TPA: dihydrofolate reductase, partial [Chthoniobacterales bacterium]